MVWIISPGFALKGEKSRGEGGGGVGWNGGIMYDRELVRRGGVGGVGGVGGEDAIVWTIESRRYER